MNIKTTLLLAVSFAVLGIAYLWRPQPQAVPPEVSPVPSRTPTSVVTRNLFEQTLGDVVKLTVTRPDQSDWVFEKHVEVDHPTQYSWQMTQPQALKVDKYQIDRIERAISQMQYEVKFRPGSDGSMTAIEAGFSPTTTVISLTDDQGRVERIEIGKPASDTTHYVRIQGHDDIIVGKGSLRDLIKRRPIDYRSTQLWTITNQDVQRIEITDQSQRDTPIHYVFVLDGMQWKMQSPVVAKATKRVNDLVAALARLRVKNWVDDNEQAFGSFGLEKPAYTIKLTEESIIKPPVTPPSGDDGDTPTTIDAAKIETKKTDYILYLSQQSPIGQDSIVYVRTNQGPAVGTILKSVADKCMPVMSQWRDMKITQVNLTEATRVELVTPEQSVILLREADSWHFDSGGQAEGDTIMEMLVALGELEAISFVEASHYDSASLGLDAPRMRIQVTIPGLDHVEYIAIGAYTDTRAKRLVYLKHNDATSMAKVKISDVQKLLRSPQAYRDRTIFSIDNERFSKVQITTMTPYDEKPFVIAYEKTFGQWGMSAPAKRKIRQNQLTSLLDILGSLKAIGLVADASQLTAYGLQTAAVRLNFTCSSPDESFTLLVSEHDGHYYAKREDGETIFQVADAIYKQAMLEYREEKVFNFAEEDVTKFSITSGDTIHEFVRDGEKWTYRWEPDLPLDTAKVKNLLLKIRDMRTNRFVAYNGSDLDRFGLSHTTKQVRVYVGNNKSITLSIADKRCLGDPQKGFFAKTDTNDDIFLITDAEAARTEVSLDELER